MSIDLEAVPYVDVGGRKVAYEVTGAPNGPCVFLMHGMPGSRVGIKPRVNRLFARNVRLVSHDRPGYGESSPRLGRTVADCAEDVAAIADELGVGTFGVVGRSAGGPHALACAALLGKRVCAAEVLGSLSPPDTTTHTTDWVEGMTELNARALYDDNEEKVEADIKAWYDSMKSNPRELLEIIKPGLTVYDGQYVDDVVIRNLLAKSYVEAIKNGPQGWIDDALAIRRDWGFDLSHIPPDTLRIYNGQDDSFTPPQHAWNIFRKVPGTIMSTPPRESHFSTLGVMMGAIARAARRVHETSS